MAAALAADDETAAYEIVFAVEATSNLVNHWESIKKQYISPIIEHFHKSSVSGNEFLTSMFKNLYGLVLFYAADRAPDLLTECFPPFHNRWQFSKLLDSIELNGGGAEHHSHIAEGLATVSQLFDDVKNQQKNKNVERFCFIISNTPPYELPATESFAYSGLSYQNLTEKLKQKNIKLSIICPHLIKELKQLFMLANDHPSPLMNYAQDKRHLVLISGFQLALEKEPWQLTDNATNDTITTIKTEVSATVPMEVTSASEDIVPQPIATSVAVKPEFPLPQPSPVQPSASTLYHIGTSAATSNPSVSQTQTPASHTIFSNVSQSVSVKSEPVIVESKPTSSRSTVPGFPTGNPVQDQKPGMPYDNAMKEAQKVIELVSTQVTPSIDPNHRLLWTGVLEWVEKRRHPVPQSKINQSVQGQMPQSKITQSVQCQISQNAGANPRDAINAVNWLPKLTVQLIPQVVVSQSETLHGYLKANKQVIFNFSPQNTAQMANLFLQKNVHGLIQHLSPNDDKLIFFFVKKRGDRTIFLGVLPEDPQGFMGALRNVIAAKFSQPRRPNMGMQQPGGGDISGQKAIVQPINQQSTVIVSDQTVNVGMQQFRGNQPRLPYQQTMASQEFPGSSNQQQQSQHINQSVNPGMANMSTINIPISQPPVNIRPQSGQSVLRPPLSDIKVMNNIRSGMTPVNNTGQQLRANVAGNVGGQRVIQSGMSIQNNPNTNMIRIQQINSMGGNMPGNRPMNQGSSQLRTLLGPGNNVMQAGNINMHQQDNSGLRSTASSNMQQQGFIRGNTLMPGMQNQRNF